MKILFDQGAPVPMRAWFSEHQVVTAFEQGWHEMKNGELLSAAEAAGFDAMLTTDKNLRYQQNLADRRLAVVVLPTTDWRRIQRHQADVAHAISTLTPGAYIEVAFGSVAP